MKNPKNLADVICEWPLTYAQGSALKAVPSFSVFCSCCCLALQPELGCSIHATWGPPFSRALYSSSYPPLFARPPPHVSLTYFNRSGRGPLHPSLTVGSNVIQGSAKRLSAGLVNFVHAVAYYFCLALSVAFTQPGSLLAKPCIINIHIHRRVCNKMILCRDHLE